MASQASTGDHALEGLRRDQWRRTEDLRRDVGHELDLAYGDHPRQRIDLYLPPVPPEGPVLVFLHGGGFRGGDHGAVGYHGRPYLEAGAVFATMGYRVLPDARFPDMCDDVEDGLDFLVARVASYGGDPDRLYLSGHSAGATLAAMAALRPVRQKEPDRVKGLVAISGMFDYARRPSDDTNVASPRYVPHLAEAVDRLPDHTIVVWGDRDLAFAAPDGAALVGAIRGQGGSVEQFVEPDADHFQANRSFLDPSGAVARAVKRMMGLSEAAGRPDGR